MSLNPGSYLGKLADAGLGEVGQNNTPAFILTFTLTHEAKDGQWVDIAPVNRDVQLFMTENAKAYAFNDLRALGFNGDMADPKFSDDMYVGLELECFHETYQGKAQEKFKIAKLKRARERKPVNADTLRSLQAQYKQDSQNTGRPTTPPPPAPRAAAPAAVQPSRPAASGGHDEPPF